MWQASTWTSSRCASAVGPRSRISPFTPTGAPGVGSDLLATARAWAHEQGADYVFLESGLARTEAHRFYVREGATHAAAAFRWTSVH
ncbi:hypothetical protein NKG94_35185 [Micromonospora sp. M12]